MKMNRIPKFRSAVGMWAVALLAVVLPLTAATPALAQSGGNKDTKNLQKKVEDSRKALQDAVAQIKKTMDQYNSLVAGDAKKPDSVYKDLSKSTDACDKAAQAVRKSVDSLHKDLDKFYKDWAKEIEGYSTDAMKERGNKSLQQVKAKFNSFDQALQGAADVYKPFIATLRDQVTFMGRDLSPAALSGLKSDGEGLNKSAGDLYSKVDAAIAATQPSSTDAASGNKDETAGEDSGGDEGAGSGSPEEGAADDAPPGGGA